MSKKREIIGEYVIAENPIDGRLVVIHYKDGGQAIIRT